MSIVHVMNRMYSPPCTTVSRFKVAVDLDQV